MNALYKILSCLKILLCSCLAAGIVFASPLLSIWVLALLGAEVVLAILDLYRFYIIDEEEEFEVQTEEGEPPPQTKHKNSMREIKKRMKFPREFTLSECDDCHKLPFIQYNEKTDGFFVACDGCQKKTEERFFLVEALTEWNLMMEKRKKGDPHV